MNNILTKHQTKTYGPKFYTEDGRKYSITATVRYDDSCGNGHNSFAITGEIKCNGRFEAGGCLHEEIAKRFPILAPYIRYHSMSSEGPLHYISNTRDHVSHHSPLYAWVYYNGGHDPLGIEKQTERLLGYVKAEQAKQAEGKPGYRVDWDMNTAKKQDLDAARSCAVWPDATDEDLTAPGLEERLKARLPQLMQEFKTAVESLGFIY